MEIVLSRAPPESSSPDARAHPRHEAAPQTRDISCFLLCTPKEPRREEATRFPSSRRNGLTPARTTQSTRVWGRGSASRLSLQRDREQLVAGQTMDAHKT